MCLRRIAERSSREKSILDVCKPINRLLGEGLRAAASGSRKDLGVRLPETRTPYAAMLLLNMIVKVGGS